MNQPDTSTQESENQQTEAKLLSLAELTIACPDCTEIDDKEGWGSSCQCQGTGQIAKYGTLREKCPATVHGILKVAPKCILCSGRGLATRLP